MDCIEEKNPEFIEDTITYTIASDLRNLLSAIKGRTILMKNVINPSNPLQYHFDEILNCLDESSDITNLLLDPHLY
ncbi:MAG: hypothetical protein KKE44_08830 [Proteobacteria bacterium]|nr:hypothetical protein [Pseudomonadota bacterium]MBU1582832.1 hypothetical protein [Pseudomonadota bacterium]MBU2451831.1 hypothetical protein [Pseudomonadota bacterium]MBU2631018.1 hypothetical protein [Pseudomonadota bacterium]